MHTYHRHLGRPAQMASHKLLQRCRRQNGTFHTPFTRSRLHYPHHHPWGLQPSLKLVVASRLELLNGLGATRRVARHTNIFPANTARNPHTQRGEWRQGQHHRFGLVQLCGIHSRIIPGSTHRLGGLTRLRSRTHTHHSFDPDSAFATQRRPEPTDLTCPSLQKNGRNGTTYSQPPSPPTLAAN
jgi:hypothetical protein